MTQSREKWPDIGGWFKDCERNLIFEVVATDENEGFVEIQYFAGEIEELEYEVWQELDLEPLPAPEDWTGPFEMHREDMGYTDDTLRPEDWSGPITNLEPDEPF